MKNTEKLVNNLLKEAKNDTKKLSKLLDEFLVPKEEEKKKNAEVSTPFSLRQEMSNKIEKNFWTKPRKVFEPCSGKGGFLIDIVDKFMDGMKDLIPDEEERYRVIVEECLYWSEINPLNVFVCKMLLKGDKYKLNYHQGNTLELDITKKWGLEGFDLVIGNPPYNKNLYKKFTISMLKITNELIFVIPSNFTISITGKKFTELLKTYNVKSIKHINKNIWNSKIDIDTLYFHLDKKYTKNYITINNIKIIKTDDIRNYYSTIHYNLIKKLNLFEKLELKKGRTKTLNYKNKIENDDIKFIESSSYKYKLLSRLNGGKLEYYYTKKSNEIVEGIKILFPRGTASYNSITKLKNTNKSIVYSCINQENISLSTGIVYILCKNIKEAEIIQWYILYSKFVRFLFITENKFSELTKGFINIIPKIDYNLIEKTNDSVYKFLKLSNEEIKFIENIF